MFNEQHQLTQEFPEYKEVIHRLKSTDRHFARLFDEYHALDRQLHRIGQEIEHAGDRESEDLKKKRLSLKDELFALLKKAA